MDKFDGIQTGLRGGRVRWRVNRPLLLGLLLLAPSLDTLFLLGREAWVSAAVDRRYTLTECFHEEYGAPGHPALPLWYVWRGQKVVFSDDYRRGTFSDRDRRTGRVRVTVNGRDHTLPYPVDIRPGLANADRYSGEAMLFKLGDAARHTERLVAVQSFPAHDTAGDVSPPDTATLHFRALFVDADGRVTEDTFPFARRASPRYRLALVRRLSPALPQGVYSPALEYVLELMWFPPALLLYPLLYPLVTGIAGLLLTVKGAGKYRRQAPPPSAPPPQ